MKFLQIHTFYESYLREFSVRNLHLGVASHDKAMKTLLADGFSACHLIAPHLDSRFFDSKLVVANYSEGQQAWRRENGYEGAVAIGTDVLRKQVEQFAPDVLYFGDPIAYDSAFVRTLSKRPSLVMGWRAAPVPDSTDWSEFDLMLSHHSPTLSLALERGAGSVAHFHPGFPRFIADAVRDEPEGADVVFAGQWSPAHTMRNQTWLDLAKATLSQSRDFSIEYYFACHAPQSLPAAVSMFNKGGKFGLDMHRALKRGRVCLNAIIDMAQGMSANMRLFEIAGTGAFQLMEHHSDIGQYFEPDVEIATYRDGNELLEKLFYYLDHPEERREIARRGQKRCLTDHCMEKRVGDFQDLVITALKRRGTIAPRKVQAPVQTAAATQIKAAKEKERAAKTKVKSLQKKLKRTQKQLESKDTEVRQIKRTVTWKLLKGVFSIEKRLRRWRRRPKPGPKSDESSRAAC